MGGACVLHCKVCRASDAVVEKMQICMIDFSNFQQICLKFGCGFEAKSDSKDSKK